MLGVWTILFKYAPISNPASSAVNGDERWKFVNEFVDLNEKDYTEKKNSTTDHC